MTIWEAELLHTVEQGPRSLGVNRARWTASLLAEYLAQKTGIQVGEERVRQCPSLCLPPSHLDSRSPRSERPRVRGKKGGCGDPLTPSA